MTTTKELSAGLSYERLMGETASTWRSTTFKMLRNTSIVAVILLVVSFVFGSVLSPILESFQVEEEFTAVLANIALTLLPAAVYLTIGASTRSLRPGKLLHAVLLTLGATTLTFAAVSAVQTALDTTVDSGLQPSLQMTLTQTDAGVLVEALEPGGAAAVAGMQVGDVITAIRRDAVTLDQLNERVLEAGADAPFRLRLLRDGEELQLTVRTAMIAAESGGFDFRSLALGWSFAVAVGLIGLFGPAGWTPYILLTLSLLPLILGYLWLIIATFSYRTHGLMPINADEEFGGLTLSNWDFLGGSTLANQTTTIWTYTFNSLVIAISMMVVSLLLCSMAGYALSRMEFTGRRFFLSLTLILHSFPAVTLIVPVYLVILNLGDIPILGDYIGYNTLGGIALIMVAFGLPFGTWLMKGFFDNISWDMERSALIDGATRWRTFWEIILPQIRPGLLALGIFSFMGGWNAYLIPAIFSVGTKTANLPVYIRQLTGEVNPVNWNQVAAVGIFQMIPIIALFVFAQEYLLNIYSGGSKGSS